MKRIKTISIALCGLVMIPALIPLRAYVQTAQRGQTVRIPVENGREITLYNRSYALVIGASLYTNGWPRLPGVQRDVIEVRAALDAHGFTVETLLNPTRDNFDRTIRRFISRYAQAPDNRILIYFAGHGYTIRTDDNVELGYIVPVDAPDPVRNGNAAFKEVAISMSEIDGYARQIESKHALFVFDSCFSGSIFDATRAVPPAITEKTSRPVRQFITAGTAEQAVPDKSIFRQQFVEALKGEGDLSKDGFITGSELGFYLEDKVANYTERAQTPQWGKIRNANLDKGDFVFVSPRRIVPAPPTAAPTPRLDPEEEAWKIVAVTKSLEVVREFLNAYPSGRYAANARIKLKELESLSNVREGPPANTVDNKAAENDTIPASPLKPLSEFENPELIGKRDINRGQSNQYSYDKEVAVGRYYSASIDQASQLFMDPIIVEYTNKVGQTIVLHSDAKVPFTIKVLDADTISATPLPGGFLYVNVGLFRIAESESEFAAALALMVAHIATRQGVEAAGKPEKLGSLPAISRPELKGVKVPRIFLSFSQESRNEADRYAVQYLWSSGYDPHALIRLYQKLQNLDKSISGTIFQLDASAIKFSPQIDNIKALISRFPPRTEITVNTSVFNQVKNRFMSMRR